MAHRAIGASAAGAVLAGTLVANLGRTPTAQRNGRILAGLGAGTFGLAAVLGNRLPEPVGPLGARAHLGQFGGALRTFAALTDARVVAPLAAGLGTGLLLFTPSPTARGVGLLGLVAGVGFAAWRLVQLATAEQPAGPVERTAERVVALPERGARAVVTAIEEAERAARDTPVAGATAAAEPIRRYLDTLVEKLDRDATLTDRERAFPRKILDADTQTREAIRRLEDEGIPHTLDLQPSDILRRARALVQWIQERDAGRTVSTFTLRNAGSRQADVPLSGRPD